ncbi:hypothetical protein [Devosia ginsengisoli]|uniref:hypothetical protein n=1 Tax=Devosia ginsengisoli TaxID=400770 RepID=UPI0026EEE114|nr:hypothetical protein [Devosia ginsengisoli]MCR6673270.1 hypothetical protein [Devosia ginsengisoli]
MWGRRRPHEANHVKIALGLAPLPAEIDRGNREAVAKALAVIDEPRAAPPAPAPKIAPTPVPPDPAGHLSFAKRAVAEMTDREAAILMMIEDEERRHIERNRELALQVRNVRMTRAFYATAPNFLTPETPMPPSAPDAPAADPAPPPKPKRSRRPKAAQADAQQQEAANG